VVVELDVELEDVELEDVEVDVDATGAAAWCVTGMHEAMTTAATKPAKPHRTH
jgi:hypothetical protein